MDQNSIIQAILAANAQNQSPNLPASAPALQQQEGDKMHPKDAIAQIMGQMQPQQAHTGGPQIVSNPPASGLIAHLLGIKEPGNAIQQPASGLLPHLLGMKDNIPVNGPNYYDTVKSAGADKFLPTGLASMPNGSPFVTKEMATEALSFLKSTQNPNNPPVTKDEFIQTYGGTEKQWKAAGLDEDGSMPFTKVRGLISKESADAMTMRATNQQLSLLMQYGGPGAIQPSLKDAYARLSNLTRADGLTSVINEIQGGKADKRQRSLLQMEIARAINPSGVITNEALNDLATDTAGQKVKDWQEWLTNTATPTDYTGFMPGLMQLVDKEKTINRDLFTTGTNMSLMMLKPSMPGNVNTAHNGINANPLVNPTKVEMIRVMNKKTGQTGSIPKTKFNAEKYTAL